MALIKCTNCGHMVSDKGAKCPKCGTPIQTIKEAAKTIEKEEKVIAEVESPKVETPKADKQINEIPKDDSLINERFKAKIVAPIDEDADKPKRHTWKKVCGIFIIAIIAIVGGYYYIQNVKTNSKSEEEITQLSDKDGEKNEQIAVPLNKNAKDNICNAYLEALRNLGDSDEMSYFLFDITNDGIPDLWVTEGNSTICDLTVFSYQEDRCNVIYAGSASHSTFYAGSNYILLWWGHQGNQAWIKLTYDGNTINSSVIFEGVVVDESDWKEPKEKKIDFHQIHNVMPIKQAFGME